MPEQLTLDVDLPCPYNVYISGRLVLKTNSKEAAWERISRQWAPHEVRDENGDIIYEFIPL